MAWLGIRMGDLLRLELGLRTGTGTLDGGGLQGGSSNFSDFPIDPILL
jgi:hypothetical protein